MFTFQDVMREMARIQSVHEGWFQLLRKELARREQVNELIDHTLAQTEQIKNFQDQVHSLWHEVTQLRLDMVRVHRPSGDQPVFMDVGVGGQDGDVLPASSSVPLA